MKSLVVFLLVAVPLVLAANKSASAPKKPSSSSAPPKLTDSVASASSMVEFMKIRKPKRSNGEIPLLIIRPVEKRRKLYFKEPTVKIASGGVATYGTYPELHTSDGEMFTLEHMLPILSLEGMLKGFSKLAPGPNHFVPSPQFKPSDVHHLLGPQKVPPKEEYHLLSYGGEKNPLKSAQLSLSKPLEVVPAQSLPSPPPPNYVPAVNSEDQLLKLGQQQPSFSPLVQEKPSFVKPEQLPASFNFKVQEEVSHYKVNAIPLSGSHGHFHHYPHHQHPQQGGATSYVGSQGPEPPKYSKPVYHLAPAPAPAPQTSPDHGKWHEVSQKKPSSLPSVTTNFYHPKTINAEPEAYQHLTQQASAPAQHTGVQTHLSYYFPKEESVPQATSAAHHSQQPTSYSNVQPGGGGGEHVEFVVQKQQPSSHDPQQQGPPPQAPPSGAEKPIHKTYSSHIKQKYQKQHHHHQPHVFIQKYFEFPAAKGTHKPHVVTEFHGTANDTAAAAGHQQPLPEPQAFAAPQYLPLPQPQALHAQPIVVLPTAQTLHHPVHHPVHHAVHHYSAAPGGPAQSYWKVGRRHQDVKPVVEHTNEPAQDSQHAASGAVPHHQYQAVGPTTTTTTSTTPHSPAAKDSATKAVVAQDRVDDGAASGSATNVTRTPTRTPKQLPAGDCERRCIRNTVALSNEPVCGTDGHTYSNRGKLRCARTCGKDDLEIRSYGICSAAGKAAP
ncbi:trithorax group protein osa-like [Anopheles cruzii]|uniref:trithorax group protein osa-like n=1 Tax=Anopheles cruzii TaxID=68878 RepID=UPI0022EC42D7|nr:trithorax group protein osa-like [Anopheles cruzii]